MLMTMVMITVITLMTMMMIITMMSTTGQPKTEKQDSFAEKLATQVIKNLQVKVTNIHVRYEDRFTNPSRPVSVGFSLRELLFQVALGTKHHLYNQSAHITTLLHSLHWLHAEQRIKHKLLRCCEQNTGLLTDLPASVLCFTHFVGNLLSRESNANLVTL